MKNKHNWKPSKYVYKNGKLQASRDPKEVGFGSRLNADLIASYFDNNLDEHAKGRLLDLGCGKVPLYAAYKDLVTENICVDWANSFHETSYLDIEHDLTEKLPFENDEFDTIIFSDVLEHIPVPEKLFLEVSRILRPHGKVIVSVPFYYWLHETPHDYYRYTEYALRRFVEESEMRVVKLEAIGGAPEIMADIFAKYVIDQPKVGGYLAIFSQWLMSKFIKTKLGNKMSAYKKSSFPLGYFLVAEKLCN